MFQVLERRLLMIVQFKRRRIYQHLGDDELFKNEKVIQSILSQSDVEFIETYEREHISICLQSEKQKTFKFI